MPSLYRLSVPLSYSSIFLYIIFYSFCVKYRRIKRGSARTDGLADNSLHLCTDYFSVTASNGNDPCWTLHNFLLSGALVPAKKRGGQTV